MIKSATFSFFIFLVASLILAKLVLPSYQEFKRLKAEIKTKEVELQNLKHLDEILVRIKEKSEDLAKIEIALPKNPDLPTLLEFIQASAAKNGLILADVRILGVTPLRGRERIKKNSLFLELLGDYSGFKNFLFSLERNVRMIVVEEINFSSPGEDKKPFPFELKISIYSY